MADTAAHLVDRVLPEVPVRQWVLSLPFSLRYRLAYDSSLTSEVLRIFIRRVFASLRRRARRRWPIDDPQCGAVTFVQRFGGALNLNVHFHTLVPPPRFNLVRYHGVLGPAARHRARVVPSGPAPELGTGSVHAECEAEAVHSGSGHREPEESRPGPRPRNYSWAELMRRVFEVDVLECPACHGPMRVLATIHPPDATRAILDCLGLPSRSPPVSPSAPEPLTDSAEAF